MDGDQVILEAREITKEFPGVRALECVSMACRRGTIHALVGENGAGKSTLMKLVAGVYRPDEGQLLYNGEEVHFHSPHDAQAKGVAIIYQEFNLLPNLNVAENILLGQEPMRRRGVLIDHEALYRQAGAVLDQLGVHLELEAPIWQLSVAEQQMVEIAKALARRSELIIMDEPSAVLVGDELENLFRIIRKLKAEGVTILYVSHRLDEIFQLADRVTVLKDGVVTGHLDVAETNKADLIRRMVGRTLAETFPPRKNQIGEPLLRVENLSTALLRDVNLTLHRGEILGLAGLVGAGRTELADAIFGAAKITGGTIWLDGEVALFRNPDAAIRARLGYVTEDRKAEGLVMTQTVRKNIALPSLDRRQRLGLIDSKAERQAAGEIFKDLAIRAPGIDHPVRSLSGGNQQKVVLAKWLVTNAEVLIFDEPTRGIDVGAKAELYSLMRNLAAEGKAILMISSELPEILGMSDRIAVMHEGRLIAELDAAEATEEKIMVYATGGEGRTIHTAGVEEGTQPPPATPAQAAFRLRSALGRLVSKSNRTALTIYGVLAALILFSAIASPSFRTLTNFQNILRQLVALGLVGIGQTFVIIAGGIDISVSAVVTLTAVLSAGIMNGEPAMVLPALLAVAAMGIVVGLANGYLVTELGIPHFVATFGTWSILRGIVLVYTRGPVGLIPRSFRFIASGHVGPLPVPALIFAAIFVVGFIILHSTRFGRYVRAVGGGPEVAHLSGVPVKRVQRWTFLISSMMGVLAGLFLAARMSVGDPNVGAGLEWDSIAAAVVGGADWLGWGSLMGTLGGALVVTALSNAMNQLNINFWYQQVLKGLIILFAVVLYRQKR